MKVVAAYLLAHLGGKASPAAEDINAILSSGEFYIAHRKRIRISGIIQNEMSHNGDLGWWCADGAS
jgi:hypothetical protein